MDLKIRLQPKQSALWDLWNSSDVTRIGFGGARGGAKSGGGRRCMLLRRLTYPGTVGLILRRTYPELYKSHILKLFEEYPIVREWYNEQRKEISVPNGSKLFFGSAEHENDMSAYYSAEFDDILADEAQEFSQGELERLSGSNRSVSGRCVPKMVYTFMPGVSESGIPPKGLNYLRRVFVKKELLAEERLHRWEFIQAFAWDNIEWARTELAHDCIGESEFYGWSEADRRDYLLTRTTYVGKTLAGITNKSLRDAWLYGKWDIFQGQYFPNYSYDLHTVEPATIQLRPWYRRWISTDWGFDHPQATYWHCKLPDGRIYTYRELWGREKGETDLGHEIGMLSAGEKINGYVMSWDAFGKLNKKTQKSITAMIGEALPENVSRPVPGDASPGSRISGWRHMSGLFDSGGWIISRECKRLIECLPTLVRDMERNSEDVLKVDYSENAIGDDPADSVRMGLQYELATAEKPEEERVKEHAATITDPVAKHFYMVHEQKRLAQLREGFTPEIIPTWEAELRR